MKQNERARQYGVHKIFGPTIQGEGGMTGTVCHFIRLSGCNMWDGRPETRADSICPFCDTDFFTHTMMTAKEIVQELIGLTEWHLRPFWITISGGEPAMQIDRALIKALYGPGWLVAVETNGTRPLDAEVDYLTVSPKLPPEATVITQCDALKILWPHPNPAITPLAYDFIDAKERYLQPIETGDPVVDRFNVDSTIKQLYKLDGRFKLSLQTHKLIGVE